MPTLRVKESVALASRSRSHLGLEEFLIGGVKSFEKPFKKPKKTLLIHKLLAVKYC